ncbi:MAG: dockerin type I domain-containing protein, partial [Gemmatimonadota bacterium]
MRGRDGVKASLGCALALAGACLAVRVEAQTIVIGPRASSISAQPGAVFTVPVVADLTSGGGASLGSASGRLTWRPAVLRLDGAAIGTAGAVVFNPDTAAGLLRFALANASGATGTPVLVNATFRVVGAPGDTTRLGVALDELTAAQTYTNLLGAAVPTPALFCAAGGRFGDIDGNDSLKSNDALYIVTNAVGLPITPHTVVNGDVDNDGKVDTRDALIVLTYVVGLPTPGFRVGQLNTFGCGITAVKTVSLQPVALTLNVGDQVPLAATARDSTNAITSATFQWLSRDTMVARVRPAHVEAVGTGATRVVVVVAPGVMDSVTVSVTGARRVWYVDQAVAASQPVENGS